MIIEIKKELQPESTQREGTLREVQEKKVSFDEDDNSLMLHLQQARRPKGYQFPKLEKYDGSRDPKEHV